MVKRKYNKKKQAKRTTKKKVLPHLKLKTAILKRLSIQHISEEE